MNRRREAEALFRRRRLIEFGEIVDERAEVDCLQGNLQLPRLGLGDVQQSVEGGQKIIGFGDRRLERVAELFRAPLAHERDFKTASEPVQGTAKIVGDIVGNLAEAVHQPLDLVKHLVEIKRQLVQLVVGAPDRDSLIQLAGHDFPAGPVDDLYAAQQVAAHENAARQAQRQGQRQRPRERGADELDNLGLAVDVAADQQLKFTGNDQVPRAGRMGLDPAPDGPPIGKFQPPARPGFHLGPGVQVPGNHEPVAVGQQIEALALIAAALPNDVGEPHQPRTAILFRQAGNLRGDGFVGLRRGEPGGRPVNEAKQQQDRSAEHRQVDQRQPEGRRLEQLRKVHEDNTPPPGPYGAVAGRSPCRSWPATG